MVNVVIYARYSSDKQTEQSIEGQLRVCKEYCERNGYNIINEYIDRALTGRTDKRPAFLEMIEDAKEKLFTYIVCYKLDRFSRNHYDSVFYKYQLKQSGVRVLSATEAISDTDEGFLMEGLLEMMAEMYSRDLSQKVKRGINENLLKGKFIGGSLPFGYKIINHKIAIDEQTAPIVQYIFNEFAKGASKQTIIQELNEQGYKPKRGDKFVLNSLNMLSNRHYTGHYELNGKEYENYYPAIIDEATFEKVQERLRTTQHKGGHHRAKEEYLLYGKVFCGHCGSILVGVSGHSKTGDKHCYYACSNRFKKHSCDKKNERKQFLEDYVIEETLNTIYDTDLINTIAEKVEKVCENDLNALKIKDYEKRLAKIERELDKITQVMIQTTTIDIVKRLDSQAKDLTIQRDDLDKELKKLRLTNKIKPTKETIIAFIKQFTNGDKYDLKYRKRIIDYFVNSVYVSDKIIITYYNADEFTAPLTFDEVKANLIENGEEMALNGGRVLIVQNKCHQQTPFRGVFLLVRTQQNKVLHLALPRGIRIH